MRTVALSEHTATRLAYRQYLGLLAEDDRGFRQAFRTAFFRAMREQLTPRQYEVLWMIEVEGLSCKQCAERLGISPSAALFPRQKAAADAACVQSGAETPVFFLAASENRHIQRFLSLCAGFVCGILSCTDECCASAVQTAEWSKKGTAVGLPLRLFRKIFAVHRQRTATHTVYSPQARQKVNCPKGKRRCPGV